MTLPTTWKEADYTTGNDVKDSFDLLKRTHPRRYLHLQDSMIRNKTATRKNPPLIQSLRVFRRPKTGTPQMCALFFFRGKIDEGHSLTIGVDPAIASTADAAAQLLYADAWRVCQHMQSLVGANALDIVNERLLPDDLTNANELTPAQIVGIAFNLAKAAGRFDLAAETTPYLLGSPWPPVLYRYPICPITDP